MSDIGLFWDSARGVADVRVKANDLETDAGMDTAIMLSLFTDRRAEPGDVLPDDGADRRGWWADTAADPIGSRLWLLSRSKETPETLRRAEEYAREALVWLVEDRVASKVEATATVLEPGVALLTVVVHRPSRDVTEYQYDYVWASREARRVS